jgi:4-carboxymuconolactone decarboxylase
MEDAMRLAAPRIAPLQDDELTEDQRAALAPMNTGKLGPLNIFRTLARAPKALTRFNEWGGYVLSRRNSLPAREREIVILRVGFLCKSGYEFTQHTRIGLNEGLSEAEIAKIKQGADAGWSDADAALIRMADDLVGDHFVSDAVWAQLKAHFDEKQCMDAVFTAGQYTQVSMFLNTFGVQLDAGQTLDPDLRA